MAILKIARMGHPVLRKLAGPVDDPAAPEVAQLARDMIETMQDAGGQGLAAPQVHVSLRLVVYFPPPDDDADEDFERRARVLVNPLVTTLGEEQLPGWEGCLSLPELRGVVPRFERIHLAAADLEGNAIDEELSGHHARVVQHECDHLDGILYPQRMTDLASLMFDSDTRHVVAEARAAREQA